MALAGVEIAFDLASANGSCRIDEDGGVGLEGAVGAQQAGGERDGVAGKSPGIGQCNFEVIKQPRYELGPRFVRDARCGNEFGNARRRIVSALWRMVVVCEAVEQVARHGHLDAYRAEGFFGAFPGHLAGGICWGN